MSKLQTTVVVETELVIEPKLRQRLLVKFRTYADLKMQEKALTIRLDKLKAEIGSIRDEIGVETVEVEGFRDTLVAGVTSTLNKRKFVELGGSLKMLENAMECKPKKAFEKITIPGAPDADD